MSTHDESPDEPLDELTAELYETLRSMARSVLGRGARPVDGTDLVHEAYLRLARSERYGELSRPGFLALCSTVLRRLFWEEARKRRDRGEHATHITSSEIAASLGEAALDALDLEAALLKLAQIDARQCRIVELRFYGGLTGDDVGEVLGLSRRTVTKEWALARAWLQRELERQRDSE